MQWEENQERMSSESPLEHIKRLRSLKLQGKKATASLIHQELSANGHSETLNIMLDDLLSPDKLITESDNIEWCKWIIASGKSPNDFSTQGKLSIVVVPLQRIITQEYFAICRMDIASSNKQQQQQQNLKDHYFLSFCRIGSLVDYLWSSNKFAYSLFLTSGHMRQI